jgi:hypothetical protein
LLAVVVRDVELPHQGQYQSHCVVGNLLRAIVWNITNWNAQPGGAGKIDVVITDRCPNYPPALPQA